jgi:hypothetical protein
MSKHVKWIYVLIYLNLKKEMKITTYKLFLESQQISETIYHWFEDLKSIQWGRKEFNENWLKLNSDHYIGEGWYEKVKLHVDNIYQKIEQADLNNIYDRMYDIWDQYLGHERMVYGAVLYGDVDRYNKENRNKFNGTLPISNRRFNIYRKKSDITVHILKSILHPTLFVGYPSVNLRIQNNEKEVTDSKYQCQNFNINKYHIHNNMENIRGVTWDFEKIKDYDINLFLPTYAPGIVIFLSSYHKIDIDLLKLENDLDEVLETILPDLDYEEVIFDHSRGFGVFDRNIKVNDYTVKILLKS